MINYRNNDVERKTIAILKLLNDSPQPLGGRVLARKLHNQGIDLGERAVRYHLKLMDERGLTRPVGRKDGREITRSGIEELGSALVGDRIGLLTTKIETLAYQYSFDPTKRTGKVPINVSLFPEDEFSRAMEIMESIFTAGLGIGNLIAVASSGEELGEIIVPPVKVGLATLSYIIMYGALLKAMIPVDSRFGGTLQIRNNEAFRFVDLIEYTGCSLDPSEVFVSGKMTSVGRVAGEGNGKILATFGEIPAIARLDAEIVVKELAKADIKGLVIFSGIGESVCQLPVAQNRVGIILADGLNPVAAAVEAGIEVVNFPMSGVIDFNKMESFQELRLNGSKVCLAY